MEGYYCPKCLKKRDPADKRRGIKTELQYEQAFGMRLKFDDGNGKLVYHAYCPVCDEYFDTEE